MDMTNSPYRVIEEKIRFHRKKADYHKQRASDWAGVLALIQALQREEQPEGKTDDFKLDKPVLPLKVRVPSGGNKSLFAREVLKNSKDGVLPVDVRKLANKEGFVVPNNYPYKIFRSMVARGEARKDQAGKYYPITKESSEQNERATLQ